MFLSRLILNNQNTYARRDIASAYQMHKTVMRPFKDDPEQRVLYRIDQTKTDIVLLVQSERRPNWDGAALYPNYAVGDVLIKEFAPALANGMKLKFRIKANPVDIIGRKRLAITEDTRQIQWLEQQFGLFGAKLLGARATAQSWVKTVKRAGDVSHTITFYTVKYDGVLEITNTDLLLTALKRGIGPSRAFGCGLLSLARA